MIRVLIKSEWSGMGARVWNVMPDDTDWPFFKSHCNVGDVIRICSRGGALSCTYEILSKDPVPDHA